MKPSKAQLKKANELNNLDVVEKKINIQMKRMEMRNDKIALDNYEPRRIAVSEDHALVNKIEELRMLLTVSAIDEERTVFGSEPVYKNILDVEEKIIVKAKLKELINKL